MAAAASAVAPPLVEAAAALGRQRDVAALLMSGELLALALSCVFVNVYLNIHPVYSSGSFLRFLGTASFSEGAEAVAATLFCDFKLHLALDGDVA